MATLDELGNVSPEEPSAYDRGLRGLVESQREAALKPEEAQALREVQKPGVIPGGFEAGWESGKAGIAQTLGMEGVAARAQARAREVAPELDYRKVTGLRSGLMYLSGLGASAAGSSLPVIGGAIAGGVAGGAVGGPIGAAAGGFAGGYGAAFPLEMGETLLEAKDQGMDTNDPKVRQAARDKAMVNAALEAAVPGVLSPVGRVGRRVAAEAARGAARPVVSGLGRRTAIGTIGEAATEGAQEVSGMEAISRLTGAPVDYNDPEVRSRLVNAILGGAVFGGGMGVLSSVGDVRLPTRGGRRAATETLERDPNGALPEGTTELEVGPGAPGGPPGGPPPGGAGAALLDPEKIGAAARGVYERVMGMARRTPTRELTQPGAEEAMFDETVEAPTMRAPETAAERRAADTAMSSVEAAGAATGRAARTAADRMSELKDGLVAGWRAGAVPQAEVGPVLDAGLAETVETSTPQERPAAVAQALIAEGPFTAQEPAAQADLFTKHEADAANFLLGGTYIPGSVPQGQETAWLKANYPMLAGKRAEAARLAYASLPDEVKSALGARPDFNDEATQRQVGEAYQEHATRAKIQRLRGMAARKIRQGGGRNFNREFGQNEFALRDTLREVLFDREQRSLNTSGLPQERLVTALAMAKGRADRKANEYAAALRHVFTEVEGQGRTRVPDDEMIHLYSELLADTSGYEAAQAVFEQAKQLYQSSVDTALLNTFALQGPEIVQKYVSAINPRKAISASQAKQLFSWIQAGLIGVGPGLDRIRTAFLSTFGGSPNTFEALVRRVDALNQQGRGIREPAGFEGEGLTPTGEQVGLAERGYVEDEEGLAELEAAEADVAAELRETRGGLPETGYGAQEVAALPEIRVGSKEALLPTAQKERIASVLEGIRQGTFGDVSARPLTIGQAVTDLEQAANRGEIGIAVDEVRDYVLNDLIAVLQKSPSDTAAAQIRDLIAMKSSAEDFAKGADQYTIFVMSPRFERTEGFRPAQVERIAAAATKKGSAEDGTLSVEVPWRGGAPRRREFSAVALLQSFMGGARDESEVGFDVKLGRQFASALGALMQSTGATNLFAQVPKPQQAKAKMPEELATVAQMKGKDGSRLGLQLLLSPAYQDGVLNWVHGLVKRGQWDPNIPDVSVQLGDTEYTLDVSSSMVQIRNGAGDIVAGPELRNDLLVYRARGGKNYTAGDLAEATRRESAQAAGIDPRELPEPLQANIRRALKQYGDPFALFRAGTALAPEARADLPYAKRLASLEKAARATLDLEARRKEAFQIEGPTKRVQTGTPGTERRVPTGERARPETQIEEVTTGAGEVYEGATPVEGERAAVVPKRDVTKAEELLKLTIAQPASTRARAIKIGSREPSDWPSDVKEQVLTSLRPLYQAYMQRRGATERAERAEGAPARPRSEALGVTEEAFARRILAVKGAKQPEVQAANDILDRYATMVREAEARTGRPQQAGARGTAQQPAELESLEFMRQTAREREAKARGATTEFGEPLYPTSTELREVGLRVLGALERSRRANKSGGAKRVFDRVERAVKSGTLNNAELRDLGTTLVANAEKNIPAIGAKLEELNQTVLARQAARRRGVNAPEAKAERLAAMQRGPQEGAPTPEGKPAAASSASTSKAFLAQINADIADEDVSTIVVPPNASSSVRETLHLSGFTEAPPGSGIWERRETPKSRARPGPTRVPRETMDAISREIKKLLGSKVAAAWEAKNFGASGEWIVNDKDAWAGVIRLAVTAADAMGVAHHEAMHALLSRLQATPEGRKAIEALIEATSQPHVVAQLRAALEGHPEAQAQLSDPLERVTYAYQLFRAKPDFRLAPAARGWFQRMIDFLRQLGGWLTNTQRAERIFEAFGEGTFSSPALMGEFLTNQLDSAGSPSTWARLQKNPIAQAVQKAIYTGDSLLRESGIPALAEIAERIQNRVGGSAGFLPERMRIGSQWVNRLFAAIEGVSEAELARAHQNLMLKKAPSSPVERRLRELLDQFYQYVSRAGVQQYAGQKDGQAVWKPVPFRKGFYPNTWNAEAIAANRVRFEQLLSAHGYTNVGQIAENIISGQVAEDNIQGDFKDGYTPMFGGASARQLDALYDDPRSLEFRSQDLVETMHRYLWQGVHRAEHTRHFGHMGQEMRALAASAEQQGATKAQLKAATDYIMAAEGTLGATIDPQLRKLFGAVTIYQNFRILPLSLFSQLVDPLGLVIRGGTFREAASAFTRGIKAAFKGVEESEMADIARLIGTIDDRSALESLGQIYGSVYMSPGQRTINDKFFRLIGLTGWNNGMRVAATEAALAFFKRQASRPGPHSERWLSELGIQPGDLQPIEVNGQVRIRLTTDEGLHPDQAARVQQAVNRWVNEAIIRPTAADRPIWASNPYFALIFYLKQFTYSFQKYIMGRVLTEARHGNYMPMLAMGTYVPVMIAADLARAMIQGAGEEPDWRKKWTTSDYVWNGVQRAGITGVPQFALDSVEDARRGSVGIESLLGPTGSQASQALQVLSGQRELSAFLLNAMPGQVVYKGWF